jgi:large subunit ribosomal protein L13
MAGSCSECPGRPDFVERGDAGIVYPVVRTAPLMVAKPDLSGRRSTTRENEGLFVRTYTPKPGEVERKWLVIDATDVVLGRLASQTAILLRGKHKPTFAPHVDGGDFVIIINADKVALTGNKLVQKKAYHHSGFPGGLKATSYQVLLAKQPAKAVEKAVRGMLPKGTLARQQLSKLKVYAGDVHPHHSQRPVPFEITQVAQ